MNWYWAIGCSNTVKKPMVIEDASLGVDPSCLDDGVPIDAWSTSAWMRVKSSDCDGEPDDVLQNHLDLPVFSQRLKDALESAQVCGFQFLPVKVFAFDGTEFFGFSIANIVELRPALDLKRSDFNVYPPDYFLQIRRGQISGIRRAVLVESQTLACDALRLTEFPGNEYLSENFRRIFEAGNFTGYSFDKVSVV